MALTKIDDRGIKYPLDLLDNEKIRLGNGQDLELFHTGTHSYIQNSVGNLLIGNNYDGDVGGDIYIQAKYGENSITCFDDGGTELFYDNSKKLETTSGGAQVTGNLTVTNNLNVQNDLLMGDTDELQMGDSKDFRIYHTNGTNYIEAWNNSNFKIAKWTGSAYENMILAASDGAVELFYDSSNKFQTVSDGVRVTGHLHANDNYHIKLGNGNDLQLYHNGSHSRITNATGNLEVLAAQFDVVDYAASQYSARFDTDAAVELYYDSTKRFETKSDGARFTGHLYSNDNEKLRLGTGHDLEIYHDGSNSHIANNTGYLLVNSVGDNIIRSNANVELQPASGETGVKVIANAGVELYNNNVKKFATGANGVFHDCNGTLNQNQIHFESGTSTGDFSTIIGVTNNPDASGFGDQNDGYWAHIISKGGTHIVLNSDGSYNSARNPHDHFSIYQKANTEVGNAGRRLFSVDNVGAVQFGRAGIKIDREWGGQPSISVQRNCNDGTDNTDDSAYFRFHGTSQTHASWTGAGSPGADFSVNLLIDGNTYATNSDRRRKVDIVDCPYGLDVVNKLQPRKYHIVNSQLEKQNNGLSLGFIAQEIMEHIPESVDYLGDEANTPNEKGWASAYAFGASDVIPVLTKAIQELSAQVETLKTKVAALETV